MAEPTETSTNRARGGTTKGPNVIVMVISLVLVIAVFAAIYATWG